MQNISNCRKSYNISKVKTVRLTHGSISGEIPLTPVQIFISLSLQSNANGTTKALHMALGFLMPQQVKRVFVWLLIMDRLNIRNLLT